MTTRKAQLDIYKALLERFGEPIGDNQAPPTSSKKKDMGNRGFGSQLSEDACCDQCGMMPASMDQGHSCGMDQATAIEGDGHMPEEMDEVTPPGGKKVVKALKKQRGVENPYAVAWSMKNKGEL